MDEPLEHSLARDGKGVTGIRILRIHSGKDLIESPALSLIAFTGVDPVAFEIDIIDQDVRPLRINPTVAAIEETSIVGFDDFPLSVRPGVGEDLGIGSVEAMEHEARLQPFRPVEKVRQLPHPLRILRLSPFPRLIVRPDAMGPERQPVRRPGTVGDEKAEHRRKGFPEPHRFVGRIPDKVADPAGGELFPLVPPDQFPFEPGSFIEPYFSGDLSRLRITEPKLGRKQK